MQDADTNLSSPGLDAPFIALSLKKGQHTLGKGEGERDEHESPAGNYYSAEKPRLGA